MGHVRQLPWMVSGVFVAGLAGCASSGDRLADMDVRATDRAECQGLRGNSAEVRADASVSESARRACEEAAVLWRSQGASREGTPIDFRRDRGE